MSGSWMGFFANTVTATASISNETVQFIQAARFNNTEYDDHTHDLGLIVGLIILGVTFSGIACCIKYCCRSSALSETELLQQQIKELEQIARDDKFLNADSSDEEDSNPTTFEESKQKEVRIEIDDSYQLMDDGIGLSKLPRV